MLRAPRRFRRVDAYGVSLAVHEWGEVRDPPVLLAHGGGDSARTFDTMAPLLADRGWRVVAWDQRGHGDSDHCALYSWDADLRDALAVADSVSRMPMPMVGHSKGGSLLTLLADACPHRVSHLVNLDGFPSRRHHPDVVTHERNRARLEAVRPWLDHRRTYADRPARSPEELIRRRQRVNPRLPRDFLRHLVEVGSVADGDGLRWKGDPALRGLGFVPLRPELSLLATAGLAMPFLAILGLVFEPEMDTGVSVEELAPYLPSQAQVVALPDTGHFVHVESPVEVAKLIGELLA
jgi:pimeloyl-ACP methyl ester carboxylesterase